MDILLINQQDMTIGTDDRLTKLPYIPVTTSLIEIISLELIESQQIIKCTVCGMVSIKPQMVSIKYNMYKYTNTKFS